MYGNPKRKASASHEQDVTTKRGRWEVEVAAPPSECSPIQASTSLISGAQNVQIYGGTFTVAAAGSTHTHTTVHNYIYAPQSGVAVDVLEILNSLSLPNFRDMQLDTFAKATEGTCVWLTKGEMFLFWLEHGNMILWGIGIPGAGKTVLASIVIRDLEWREEASGGTICVAYVYLRYGEPLSVRDVLESLVKQIVERHIDLIPVIEALFRRHKQERTKPPQQDLMGALMEFIRRGKTLIFVLDALDEMRAEERPILVRLLASLEAKLFITSRPLDTLQQQFPQAQVFSIAACRADIDLHIQEFLRHCPDLMAILEGTDLEGRIVDAVHQKSGGMFLHVKLQLEALRHCISAVDVEENLEEFPTDINVIYMRTWDRIVAQPPKHSHLAKLALHWLTHARTEITVDTLRLVVTNSPETYLVEPKRMVPEALLLSVCCGLVAVDERTRIVRLMHYTTRDAILPRILELNPMPHGLLVHVCVAHLVKCNFQIYRLEAGTGDEEDYDIDLDGRLSNDTLLAYAYRSWVHHAFLCDRDPSVVEAVTKFVLHCTTFPLESDVYPVDLGGPLHVAAYYGLEDLLLPAAQLQSPDAGTAIYKWSPLMLALRGGHLACARAILSMPGVDVNLRDARDWNALMQAAFDGHTEATQLLLQVPDIDINAVDGTGKTALIICAAGGTGHRTEVAKLLLASPDIKVNAADDEGQTALIKAVGERQIGVSTLLASFPGVDVNAHDEKGWTALVHATDQGNTECVRLLLEAPGIDVNVVFNSEGDTALSHACSEGYADIAELLLAFPGIDIPEFLDSP